MSVVATAIGFNTAAIARYNWDANISVSGPIIKDAVLSRDL